MRLRVGDVVRRGSAVEAGDLPVDAGTICGAIRGENRDVALDCAPPGPIHDHVGVVADGRPLAVRGALAAAARSRGRETRLDAEIRELREALAAPVSEIDLSDVRRRVATAGDEEAMLRERVASLRGRVAALRDRGDEPVDARAELRSATTELAEVETERLAAEQAHAAARRESRAARDRRAERLRREDRLANAERERRRVLAAGLADEFERAVRTVPGGGTVGNRPDEFRGETTTAALAVVRVASTECPVVIDCRRFASAAAARDCLDTPVIRL